MLEINGNRHNHHATTTAGTCFRLDSCETDAYYPVFTVNTQTLRKLATHTNS